MTIHAEDEGMKLIVAIIRPERLDAVQEALNQRDVYLMTVSDVRGCGRQRRSRTHARRRLSGS